MHSLSLFVNALEHMVYKRTSSPISLLLFYNHPPGVFHHQKCLPWSTLIMTGAFRLLILLDEVSQCLLEVLCLWLSQYVSWPSTQLRLACKKLQRHLHWSAPVSTSASCILRVYDEVFWCSPHCKDISWQSVLPDTCLKHCHTKRPLHIILLSISNKAHQHNHSLVPPILTPCILTHRDNYISQHRISQTSIISIIISLHHQCINPYSTSLSIPLVSVSGCTPAAARETLSCFRQRRPPLVPFYAPTTSS